MSDELWPHFKPLWDDLRKSSNGILLAGGYGLFLKQQWLAFEPEGKEARVVIPVEFWKTPAPRVTKDFDVITGLDLIASETAQKEIHGILERHRFAVVPQNSRWQFSKELGPEHRVILDFHAPVPARERDDVRTGGRRIKPRNSQRNSGFHGRENPEAAGCEINTSAFTFRDTRIELPNPVTLTVMKLVAMQDRWTDSQTLSKPQDQRDAQRAQADKHASDVFRIVAMMTRQESDGTGKVLAEIRATASFERAAGAFREHFDTETGGARRANEKHWSPESLESILSVLQTWFGRPG